MGNGALLNMPPTDQASTTADWLAMTFSEEIQLMVQRYVRALCWDPHAAADLSQEVFLRAIERSHRIYTPENPVSFLKGIARKVVLEHRRERQRGQRYDEVVVESLVDGSAEIAEVAAEREQRDRLHQAIEALPIVSRRLLEMRYHDNCDATTIAAAFEMTPVAVRVTLKRIRDRLRRQLQAP